MQLTRRAPPYAQIAIVIAVFVGPMTAAAPQPRAARLDFEVQERVNLNRFVREGKLAAHLLLRSGTDPRIVIAFPAGNSGVGLWFVHHADRVSFRLRGPPVVVHDSDGRGRMLYGISADATVEGQDLQIRQAVLSSIRVLRDYQLLGTMPSALAATPTEHGHTVSWSRDRLDAAPGYRLVLEVTQGQLSDGHIRAGPDGKIGLRITGLTGETPLTPLLGRQLLNDSAGSDAAARDTLTFLAYREKLLAGSWRFDTYFGRDTLMAVRLLMPVLSATAVEAGLSSVLARLSVQGEVAHEVDMGARAEACGGGRYPSGVHAVLVPAALEAAAQLNASGLLSPYLTPADRALFARAPQMASVWRAQAPQLFEVAIPPKQAHGAIEAYG